MKKILVLIIITLAFTRLYATPDDADTTGQHLVISKSADSLKTSLSAIINDSLKGPAYTKIAEQYLKYDTISSRKTRFAWQNQSITYTMKALHYYSKYDDTTGLRVSFDDLAKAYHAQKKYTQAKWFILQSNTLSRAKHDDLNIITSLLELALIKTDIKDYTLAMRDLNEALTLSSKNHYAQLELNTMQNYAILYSHMKNYPKEARALKRRDAIADSIRHDREAVLMAKISKADSVQSKKKLYIFASKKTFKAKYVRRIASL